MNGVKDMALTDAHAAETGLETRHEPKKEIAFGIAPASFEDAWRMASAMAKSAFVPKDFQNNPANILVAMQMGAEVGLTPMQSLQSIAVINGRPSIWGDAMLALVMASPLYVNHDETLDEGTMTALATFVRKNKATPIVRQFSRDDAIKAGLWGKSGPWQTYPKRMLQMRARGLALRDGFPDVLKGLSIAEEAIDIPKDRPTVETVNQARPEPEGFDDWLTDLKACADEGLSKLTTTWQESRADYREHLARTDTTAWERLKAIATERSKHQDGAA